MKVSFPAVIFGCLVLLSTPACTQSQMDSDRNFIHTEGTAEVTGQNDSARISIISTQPISVPVKQQVFRTAKMALEADAMAPPIESGESKIQVHVSIAYEME